MSDKTRNYIYYAALIFFFFINIVTLIHGFKYSGFASKKDFQGTNFGMLIFLSAIGGIYPNLACFVRLRNSNLCL